MEKWIKQLIIIVSLIISIGLAIGLSYVGYVSAPEISEFVADRNYNCDESNVYNEVKKVDSLSIIISDRNISIDSLSNDVIMKNNQIKALKDMLKINENKYRLLEKSLNKDVNR